MEENGFKNFLASTAGKIVMIIVFYLIIFGILYGLIMADVGAVAGVIAIVLGFFGWGVLDRITPDIFLFMSCSGWIAYFVIKGMLSIAIGMFVAPFVFAKWVANQVQNSLS